MTDTQTPSQPQSSSAPAEPGGRRAWRRLALELTATVATVLGSPDGQRVTHHKGIVMAGTFTATSEAARLTRAAHMTGDPVPVTVRFSNGFPSPLDGEAGGADTTHGDPRGMAVKFTLPDGTTTDLVCQDWPVFPAPTPEKFRDLLRAQHEGEEAAERYLADHPDVAAAGALVAQVGTPPRSWATQRFHSINAFRLVDAEGRGRFVRWSLDPEAGEHALAPEQLETAHRDYLMGGIHDVLPFRYRVMVQLAEDDDDVTNPSVPFPAERAWVEMGVVEVTGVDETRERDGDVLVHDPMRLVDGIEPSADPILLIRPHVYAESVRRRSGAACPAHLL